MNNSIGPHRVVITSANTAHYIALPSDGNEREWFWTRAFERAHRFEDKAKAEAFAAHYLPDLTSKDEVWFLGRLY